MLVRRTTLTLAALALATPIAACSGTPASSPTASTTVVVTAPATSPDATGDTATVTAPGTSGTAPATSTARTQPSGRSAPSTTVTVTATEEAPATTAPTDSSGTQTPRETAVPTTSQDGLVTLGVRRAHGSGFGVARPGTIDFGGTSSGVVKNITWSRWGGETALGTGTGWYVPKGKATAEGQYAPVTVRASGLTSCGGGRRYETVVWWFHTKGETDVSPEFSTRDLCQSE